MKKIIFAILIFALPTVSFAAISYDNSIDSGISGSSPLVTGMTLSGSATMLYCAAIGTNITNVTYNSVGLTKLNQSAVDSGGRRVSSWELMNPATGSNNVSVTFTGSDAFYDCSSYIGVGGIDTNTSASGTPPLTTTLTTSYDNDWTVLGTRGSSGGNVISTTSGANQRQENTGIGSALFDNGPVTPAGSTNIGVTSGDSYLITTMMSFYPTTTSTPPTSTSPIAPMADTSATISMAALVNSEIVALPVYALQKYETPLVGIAILLALVGGIYGGLKHFEKI